MWSWNQVGHTEVRRRSSRRRSLKLQFEATTLLNLPPWAIKDPHASRKEGSWFGRFPVPRGVGPLWGTVGTLRPIIVWEAIWIYSERYQLPQGASPCDSKTAPITTNHYQFPGHFPWCSPPLRRLTDQQQLPLALAQDLAQHISVASEIVGVEWIYHGYIWIQYMDDMDWYGKFMYLHIALVNWPFSQQTLIGCDSTFFQPSWIFAGVDDSSSTVQGPSSDQGIIIKHRGWNTCCTSFRNHAGKQY